MTDILRCTHDREPLAADDSGLRCPRCARHYILAAFSLYDETPLLAEILSEVPAKYS